MGLITHWFWLSASWPMAKHHCHVKKAFPHGDRDIVVRSGRCSSNCFSPNYRALLKFPLSVHEDLTQGYGLIIVTDGSIFQHQLLHAFCWLCWMLKLNKCKFQSLDCLSYLHLPRREYRCILYIACIGPPHHLHFPTRSQYNSEHRLIVGSFWASRVSESLHHNRNWLSSLPLPQLHYAADASAQRCDCVHLRMNTVLMSGSQIGRECKVIPWAAKYDYRAGYTDWGRYYWWVYLLPEASSYRCAAKAVARSIQTRLQ